MVEPLFRFDGSMTAGTTVVLAGTEGHHAAAVRRMRVGEAIALTDGKGTRARGQVSEVEAKQVSIKLATVETEEPAHPRFTLVQAVAKGDRDEMAVQATTELGVSNITPWQASRSVSRWDGKEAKNIARWQSIADEASKQSLRSRFAQVSEIVSTQALLKRVSMASETKTVYIVLDPTAAVSIVDETVAKTLSDAAEIAVVVGPEGGIETAELQSLQEAGAIRVHLGAGILRTSTAGVAAVAYLSGALGKWQ